MRKQAKKDFEKNFYKFTSNACFGKTMENLRRRSVIEFVSNTQQAETFAQRATFKSFQIIKQDLVSVSFKNLYVLWTKTTPVGAAILDLSKLSLYKFHYEEMIARYWSGQLKVAYENTDSLLYLIETPDFYKDMASKHLLDLSLPTKSLFAQSNKYESSASYDWWITRQNFKRRCLLTIQTV